MIDAVLQQKVPGARPAQRLAQRAGQCKAKPAGGAAVLAGALAAVVSLAGCGSNYRPVVSAINPVGPASQPTKYAAAMAIPASTSVGLLSVVDVSGDTVLATPSVIASPSFFTIDPSGSTGFVLNRAGSLENFGLTSPTSLRSSELVQSTLAAGAVPQSLSPITLANSAGALFVPEQGLSRIAVLSNYTSSPTLTQEISVPANPTFVVGANGTQRVYAISQLTGTTAGQLSAIESSTFSISATIPVGTLPVYGVETADDLRAFILNKGSGTVSVVNVVNNALDNTTPTITLPAIPLPGGGTTAPNPVWADLSPRVAGTTGNNQLVVLNQGNGTTPGTLSVISIPLCTATAQVTNPNCNSANPIDATGFGTILATVTVGINPQMVSVLQDGSRAYVVNAGNAAAGVEGSVTIVDLNSFTVRATIPAVSTAAATVDVNTTPGSVYGHPNTVAATTGKPTGKVYVTSYDNQYLTVIETDTDSVKTHISLQGLGMPLPAQPAGASAPLPPQSPGVMVTAP